MAEEREVLGAPGWWYQNSPLGPWALLSSPVWILNLMSFPRVPDDPKTIRFQFNEDDEACPCLGCISLGWNPTSSSEEGGCSESTSHSPISAPDSPHLATIDADRDNLRTWLRTSGLPSFLQPFVSASCLTGPHKLSLLDAAALLDKGFFVGMSGEPFRQRMMSVEIVLANRVALGV